MTNTEAGKRLAQMRNTAGKTQGEMSAALGKGQTWAAKVESGKIPVRLDIYFKWASICGFEAELNDSKGTPTARLGRLLALATMLSDDDLEHLVAAAEHLPLVPRRMKLGWKLFMEGLADKN